MICLCFIYIYLVFNIYVIHMYSTHVFHVKALSQYKDSVSYNTHEPTLTWSAEQ